MAKAFDTSRLPDCSWCAQRLVWPWQTPARHKRHHDELVTAWAMHERDRFIDQTVSNLLREDHD